VSDVSPQLESACNYDLRNPRAVSASCTAAKSREKCGLCFPDGTIPEDVDEVLVGHYKTKVHLTDDHEADSEGNVPDEPVNGSNGLAAKIGSEDFGPEDIEELASRGGDA